MENSQASKLQQRFTNHRFFMSNTPPSTSPETSESSSTSPPLLNDMKMSTFPSTPVPSFYSNSPTQSSPVPQYDEFQDESSAVYRYAQFERKIRQQRVLTKTLTEERNKLEPEVFEHLKTLPNAMSKSDDLTFAILNKKRKRPMNTEHMIEHIASFNAYHSMYPDDHRCSADFDAVEHEFENLRDLLKKDSSNSDVRSQLVACNRRRRELYTLVASDLVQYIESSRQQYIVPTLSRRSNKRRKIKM